MTVSFYIIVALIGMTIISALVHLILFAIKQHDKKKNQEKTMIENAALFLNKIDKQKQKYGGNKMDKDLKKVAKYLADKIDTIKEEIIEEIETKFEELEGGIGSEEVVEEEESEFDSLFGEDEEEPIVVKALPDSLDVNKRTMVTPPEEEKPKKKGLFSKKT